MVGRSKFDRRGSGPIWFAMLAIVLFFLYSVAVAVATLDRCGDAPKTWDLFPPGWQCQTSPGFG